MKIYIGADQGGVDLKNELYNYLKKKDYEVEDLGIYDRTSIDYPDKAVEVCKAVLQCEAEDARGIIVCGTGIGVSISANKVKGIRAALVTDCFSARMARQHNNANVITLGGRTIGVELAIEIVSSYLNAEFEGGRHARRVDKINQIMDN
ncbi:MAG TPA: ribose 5-phosphate isomerase B [Clostridiaceae bacterium]|nr:ribose 5-phosphate isomerase B [Clostridiaceae bacterium]